MEEKNHGLHQQVNSDVVSVSITISHFLTHQQVRQLEEEKTHSQQRTREMGEENRGLQQQVSLHVDIDINWLSTTMNILDTQPKLLFQHQQLHTLYSVVSA